MGMDIFFLRLLTPLLARGLPSSSPTKIRLSRRLEQNANFPIHSKQVATTFPISRDKNLNGPRQLLR